MTPALRQILMSRRQLWTPDKLLTGAAPYVAFFDPSQGVTQSSGLASAWADALGGATVAQSSGSLKPAASMTAINGFPGISPDGTDDVMTLVGVPAAFPTGGTTGWMFALVDQAALVADNAQRMIFTYGSSTSNSSRGIQRAVVSGANRMQVSNTTVDTSETTVDFSGVCAVWGLFTSTTQIGRINGVETAPAAVTVNTATTRVRMGAYIAGSASNYWLGGIGPVFVGTGTPSTADKERLEAWALWSYGKSAQLPAAHTYRNVPPKAELFNDNWTDQGGLLVPARRLVQGFRLAA